MLSWLRSKITKNNKNISNKENYYYDLGNDNYDIFILTQPYIMGKELNKRDKLKYKSNIKSKTSYNSSLKFAQYKDTIYCLDDRKRRMLYLCNYQTIRIFSDTETNDDTSPPYKDIVIIGNYEDKETDNDELPKYKEKEIDDNELPKYKENTIDDL